MTEENTGEARPEGWQQVDYTKLPADVAPVVEARINRLYGQVKKSERDMTELKGVLNQLAEDNKTLLAQFQESATAKIKENLRAAAESGEYEKIATLTEELVKSTSKPEPKATPKQEPEPEKDGGVDLSEHLSTRDEALVAAWYAEKDEEGKPLRPWGNPQHEDFEAAATVFTAAWNRPSVKSKGIEAVLAEVDRAMGVQKPRPAATVMRNSGPGARPKGNGLTAEQKEAARLMGVSEDKYRDIFTGMQKAGESGEKVYRKVFDD